jgi:ketosteroid isomerase-like protein
VTWFARRTRRGLLALAWAGFAWSCAPTITPFNEPLGPTLPSSGLRETTELPEDPQLTPYVKHVLTEKIVEYAKVFCRRRESRSTADYAPDALLQSPGGPDARGLNGIAAELLSDTTCPGPQVFIRGGTAVILGAAAGTHTGAMFGLEPTGKVVGVMTATAFVFTPDGKIIEQREYADAATLFAQLGVYDRPRRRAMVPRWVLECHIATGELEERTNAALARRMQRAFEQRDEAAYAAALDDDVMWDDYTAVAPTRGKAEVVKRFDAQAGAISRAFLDCDARGIVDYVVSECTLSGIQTGPLVAAGIDVAPTNRDVVVHTLEIVQIREGKVLRGWTYGNGVELARELGVWREIAPRAPQRDAGGATDAGQRRY